MSGGYVCVFDDVFDGSLAGRWPTLPVWLTLLPLADADGEIDLTLQAISVRTGWPFDLLKQAIDELMQPDPQSRSDAEQGRRLVPLDPDRSWGWRVVNIAYYRELARLAAKSREEVRSGSNRIRMSERRKIAKERTAADRREPPPTAADRLSDADADADADKDSDSDTRNISGSGNRVRARESKKHSPEFTRLRKLYPPIDRKGEPDWHEAERRCRQLVDSRIATWAQLEAGVQGLARYVASGGYTPNCVPSPVTFFDPADLDRPWAQEWR